MTQRFRKLRLLDQGRPVAPLPGGVLLSTHPRQAVDAFGWQFIVKGDTVETVVAESLGYALAEMVGLPTPEWGLTEMAGSDHLWFASQMVDLRQTEAVLRTGRYINTRFLSSLLVFDQWVANADRNVNNIVARIPFEGERGEVELLAIDFEKSYVLRGESQLMTFTKSPVDFLPRQFLRDYLTAGAEIDTAMVRRIHELTNEQLKTTFHRFHKQEDGLFPPLPIEWADRGVAHLRSRADRIDALLEEALNA